MSWVQEFFNPTHHGWDEKKNLNPTQPIIRVQPNTTHMNWVGPVGWTFKKEKR